MAVSRLQSILALTSAVVAVGGVAWWAAVRSRPSGDVASVELPNLFHAPAAGSQPTAPTPLSLSNPGSQVLFSFAPGPALAASGGALPPALAQAPAAGQATGSLVGGGGSPDATVAPCNCPDNMTRAYGSVAAAGRGLGNVLDYVASQVPSIYASAVGPSLGVSLNAANDQRAALLAVTNVA